MGETTDSAGSGIPSGLRPGPRTTIHRKPDRAVPDRAEEILMTGKVADVAWVADGEPRIVPVLYGYRRDEKGATIVLHGAHGSSMLRDLRPGVRVAVSVWILDALIASKDAESHSANYRSVVAHGVSRRITDPDEKVRLLEEMTRRYFPGRTMDRDYAAATEAEIKAMDVVEVVLDESSAKTRVGPPNGPRDADSSEWGTAGIYRVDGTGPADEADRP